MSAHERETPLPVVIGPTGSGKSDLAVRLALAVGGEIVNCDSLQVYRGLNIGTAKMPERERLGVPHHLIDVIEPRELFTAGDYAHAARQVLREIAVRERIPIVVGGTGFYLRALLEGLSRSPRRDEDIRARLERREKRRPGSLHRLLKRLDPRAASRIHANDRNKLIRALEVRLVEGEPISKMFATGRDPLKGFRAIKLGLDPPRKLLYERLDARAASMFEGGLIDEVRRLLSNGVSANAKPFESLGYRQALQVIEGQATLEQAVASTQLETRRYAKRQMTWFRKEQDVHWIAGLGGDPEVLAKASRILGECLS